MIIPPKEGVSVNPEEVNKKRKLEQTNRYEKVSDEPNRYENVSVEALKDGLDKIREHDNLPRRTRCTKCGLMLDSSYLNCPTCGVIVGVKQ